MRSIERNFRKWMVCGHGRAMSILRAHKDADLRPIIFKGCVSCLQLDPQFEGSHTFLIASLAEEVGLVAEVLDEIERCVRRARNRRQETMFHMLSELAHRGHTRAFDLLVREAIRGTWSAFRALASSGIEGLRWLVANRLPSLADDCLWELDMWVYNATSSKSLDAITALDPELSQTIEAARARMPEIGNVDIPARANEGSLADAIDQAVEGGSLVRPASRAMSASHEELIAAAERLLKTSHNREAFACARAFTRREFPLDPRLLIERIDDPDVGGTIIWLLGHMNSEEIREAALEFASRRPVRYNALEMLNRTFRESDEELVSSVVRECRRLSRDDLHSVVLDLLNLSKQAGAPARERWLRWTYESSPCSICRSSAVIDLVRMNAFPEEWRQEAMYDADEDIRRAVKYGLAGIDGAEGAGRL